MDTIRISGLELRCIVGLRSYERHRAQPIQLDIVLGMDLSAAGRSGQIEDSVDYSLVADGVAALLRFREYRLLEVAAEEAAAFIFAAFPLVQKVGLRIDKPEALAGRARSAAVEISRSRGAYGTEKSTKNGLTRVELLRSREAMIEVYVQASPSANWPSATGRRLEWYLGGAGQEQPLVLGAGEVRTLPPVKDSDTDSAARVSNTLLRLVRCTEVPEQSSEPPEKSSGLLGNGA